MKQAFIISYDLQKGGQQYQKLHKLIEQAFPEHLNCLQSTWIVVGATSANAIVNTLQPALDDNDKILVMPVARPAVAQGFPVSEANRLRDILV